MKTLIRRCFVALKYSALYVLIAVHPVGCLSNKDLDKLPPNGPLWLFLCSFLVCFVVHMVYLSGKALYQWSHSEN